MNTISAIIVFIALFACVSLVFLDPTHNVVWVGLTIASFAILPLIFTWLGKYKVAKFLFVTLFFLMYLIISLIYGKDSRAEYAIIFIPAFSFILFDRINRSFLFILSVISLIAMQYIYTYMNPILELPHHPLFLSYTGIVFIVCFFFVMDYFKEQTTVVENQLLQNYKTLENTNQKLNLANEQLYQFTSIASHDMREPLRTISNFSKILRRKMPLDDTNIEYLNFIEDSSQRLHKMTEDLIEYARIGVNEKETQGIDLNDITLSVEQNLNKLIKDEKAKIIVKGILPKVLGHKTLWVQLMQNMINNSIKYHRENVPPIITIEMKTQDNSTWILKISDNGIGIDSAYFTNIFEPFRRLHSHHEYSGSGIGLATCKKIVEHYEGHIKIASVLGKGTDFLIEFPQKCLIE
jgi:signal transduction histidine kinase